MDKSRQAFGISRRSVMRGAAAVAGAAALGNAGGALAQSQGRIVVGTWGGDYARLLHKNIGAPILTTAGWEVVHARGGDPQLRSNLLAEQQPPRAPAAVHDTRDDH